MSMWKGSANALIVLLLFQCPGAFGMGDRTYNLGFFPPSHFLIGPFFSPDLSHPSRQPSGSLAVGDFDGDGEKELVLGESGTEIRVQDGATLGLVTLVKPAQLGASALLDPYAKEQNSARAYFSESAITPDNVGIAMGHALAAGDLNGDGLDDLIIAEPCADPSQEKGIPRIHIVFGKKDFVGLNGLTEGPYPSPQKSNVVVYGPSGQGFGASLACGDMNKDNLPEVIIGAPFRGEDHSGAIWVLPGRSPWPPVVDLRESNSEQMIVLDAPGGWAGWALQTHDLDQDGDEELVVSAPRASSEGRESVGLVAVVAQAHESPNLDLRTVSTLYGDVAQRSLGTALACGQDSWGPFVGAGACAPAASQVDSAVYVFRPKGLSLPAALSDILQDAGFSLTYLPEAMGEALSAGDADGDQNDELAIGIPEDPAPAYDPEIAKSACGRVFMVTPFKIKGRAIDLRPPPPDAVFLDIYGSDPQTRMGSCLALADLNKDGKSDLVTRMRGLPFPGNKVRQASVVLIDLEPHSGYVPPIPARVKDSMVLLVTCERNADSVAIAKRYKELHPGVSEIALKEDLPVTRDPQSQQPIISAQDYARSIVTPICKEMDAQDLWTKIRYIVTTKGMPLRLGNQSSVDAQLCLLALDWRNGELQERDMTKSLPNPYAYMHLPFSAIPNPSRPAILLVTRIDGYTLNDALGVLERSQNPVGAFEGTLIVDNDNQACQKWKVNPALLQSIEDRLKPLGAKVLYEDSPQWVTRSNEPVTGYFSWGMNSSNLTAKDAGYVSNLLGFQYAPGAAFLTIESFNGRTFDKESKPGAPLKQGLLADFIEKGGSCGIGNVSEPTLGLSARPDIFFVRMALGYGLADAAYAAIPELGWKQVVIGDPLLQWPTQRPLFTPP